ncbi:hypothetical protein HY029_01170 [Candidatus Gottesmanbacteria bacterium]|nr:hypothetical protein [Candidatus Gottesmanbacteria bacterium]
MSYYRNFKIVLGNPLWRIYLQWAYKTGIQDLEKLRVKPNFSKKDFTALLCGVGNENTADEFIKFILERNEKAKIIIIDIGNEQIEAVKKLVATEYPNINIVVKQTDVLKLGAYLGKSSIDWIETDGFLEYFDPDRLGELLSIWKTILAKNGFITFRDFITEGFFGKTIDTIKMGIAKIWLGVTLHPHDKNEFLNMLESFGFRYFEASSCFPTYRRYLLINR